MERQVAKTPRKMPGRKTRMIFLAVFLGVLATVAFIFPLPGIRGSGHLLILPLETEIGIP
jgi:uncharacterized membrane protein